MRNTETNVRRDRPVAGEVVYYKGACHRMHFFGMSTPAELTQYGEGYVHVGGKDIIGSRVFSMWNAEADTASTDAVWTGEAKINGAFGGRYVVKNGKVVFQPA